MTRPGIEPRSPGRLAITQTKELDIVVINKKKTCHIVDFIVLTDHRVNMTEGEKFDKLLDLAIELKKLWNIKVDNDTKRS